MQENEEKKDGPERPLDKLPISQRQWRRVGAGAIGLAALMAWFGENMARRSVPLAAQLIYWGVFTLLIAVALYVVLLDIRYIRLQYALSRREVFLKTLGSKEFREALRARNRARDSASGDDSNAPPNN